MPSYNTRLRTNSVLLPPRRLRHSPSPPPRPRHPKHKITATPPCFPPLNVVLHPDDANNKTLLAIGRALLAVDNRAVTIKDLSQLTLDCGLVCQNVSAASQAITTFIRSHLARCRREDTDALLSSLTLTGTPDDDRLAPALYSRSGGTSSPRDQPRALTSFRKGTMVWYLSDQAGAPCPFKRAGLSLDDFSGPAHGLKRKRESRHAHPRKLPASGPAMATRHRAHADAPQPEEPHAPARLCVKLTLRVPEPDSDAESESNAAPSDSDDPVSPISDPASVSDAASAYESSPPPAPCLALPPYPILSPSIPSPVCATPSTSLASPSAPYASFPPLTTALSNPPRDYRSRSCSLPFSSASPPPDSEDEDEDFHNSMVGLRRGSVPLLKKEDDHHDWSTPLELLPGFLPFDPAPVKTEPTSAILPPAPAPWGESSRWDSPEERWSHFKREHPSDDERTVLDPDDAPAWGGKGTRDDPVRVDPAVSDVEVLGPESVRSREWDAAWCSASVKEPDEDRMEVDGENVCEQDAYPCRQTELCASPAETLDTVPTAMSSPPSDQIAPLDGEHDLPFIMHPLRPCDPPVVATVIEGIPVYHTLLAPGLPLLRRIDTALVTLAPLLTFLGLPPAASRAWAPLTVAHGLALSGAQTHPVPQGVLDVFLRADLGVWFPDALARLVQLHAGALEAGIRAEDVFAPHRTSEEREALPELLRAVPLAYEVPRGAADAPVPLDEQEETLFRSFVDFTEPLPPAKPVATASAHAKENTATDKENAGAQARRRREKAGAEQPVRRSKRGAAAKLAAAVTAPITRSRSRGTCAEGRANA